jgi:hypothetical protein
MGLCQSDARRRADQSTAVPIEMIGTLIHRIDLIVALIVVRRRYSISTKDSLVRVLWRLRDNADLTFGLDSKS